MLSIRVDWVIMNLFNPAITYQLHMTPWFYQWLKHLTTTVDEIISEKENTKLRAHSIYIVVAKTLLN